MRTPKSRRSVLTAGMAAAATAAGVAAAAGAAPNAPATEKAESQTKHRVAFHVDSDDPALLNLILNNITNLADYYADQGETAAIEVVAYGPGLRMLRADTSPVLARMASLLDRVPGLVFSACAKTMASMSRAEGKEIKLAPETRVVPAGAVRLVELQERGWSYLKP